MCLMNILNDSLIRYLFRIIVTLFDQDKKCVLKDILIDSDCIEINIVINKSRVTQVYKDLKLEIVLLSVFKSLRDYNEKLFKKLIIYYLLFKLNLNKYREETCLILIALI